MMIFLLLFSLFPKVNSAAPDTVDVTGDHYRIYTSAGVPASLEDIRAAMNDVDVVFVGELHDDPVSHFIEQRVLEGLYAAHGDAMALSMEMFARDVQYIVDEYLNDQITESHFRSSSSPWSNYESDYKPMVEFSKAHGLQVIAANAPRRYSNRVTRLGRSSLQELSDRAQSFLAPLPYGSASAKYKEQWDAVMAEGMAEMIAARAEEESNEANQEADQPEESEHGEGVHGKGEHGAGVHGDGEHSAQPEQASSPEHGGSSMLDAQTLWDATMAWSIAEHLTRNPGSKVVHMVGGFHVSHGTGTPEHLSRYRPDARTLIVSVQRAEDVTVFDPEEHAGLGDFVVLGDSSLPPTYKTRTR